MKRFGRAKAPLPLPVNEWQRLNPEVIERWLQEKGFVSVSIASENDSDAEVVCCDHEGYAGLGFTRPTLTEAVALAEKMFAEVEGPDDVGHDECERQAQAWFAKNDPEHPYAKPHVRAERTAR